LAVFIAARQRAFTDLAASRGLAAVVDQIVNSAEYRQSFGDWRVPGSGGVSYCGTGRVSRRRGRDDRQVILRSNADVRMLKSAF